MALFLTALAFAWTPAFVAEFSLAKLLVLNLGLLLAACAWLARPKLLAWDAGREDAAVLLGLLVVLLGAAFSVDPWTSLRGRYNSYADGLWGWTLCAAVFAWSSRALRGREEAGARALAVSAAALGGYAVLQRLGWDPILGLKSPPQGRAVSMLGSAVDLGGFLAVALCPALAWARRTRAAGAAAAALIAAGLLASGSRGALLAAAVSCAAYFLMLKREPRPALSLSAALALAAAAAGTVWALRAGAGLSDAGRVEVWKTAWSAFAARPWLGWGPDAFEAPFRLLRSPDFARLLGPGKIQAYAHNDVLHLLATLGLCGLAAYLAVLASLAAAARRALSRDESRPLGAAFASALLARWLVGQHNPLALEAGVLACAAAGLLVSVSRPARLPRPAPRWAPAAAVVLVSLSLGWSLRQAAADASHQLARRAQARGDFSEAERRLDRARALMPCETAYSVSLLNSVGEWINAKKDAPYRLACLEKAERAAAQALACHPRDVTARYSSGMAAYLRARSGFKESLSVAARELDEALKLDPTFEPLLALRREVARRARTGRTDRR